MIRIKNGEVVGNYIKLPNRKKQLITKEFCEDLRDNLIKLAIENDKTRGYYIDYSNECYMGFYSSILGTSLFYEALKETCIKHNVVKAIYEYANNMEWYDSDCFENDIALRMVELGVIPYTTEEWERIDDFIDDEDNIEYHIIFHHTDKGYRVIQHGTWDKNDKAILEKIYEDCKNAEIIWFENK